MLGGILIGGMHLQKQGIVSFDPKLFTKERLMTLSKKLTDYEQLLKPKK